MKPNRKPFSVKLPEKVDNRADLDRLEGMIWDLKTQYEQYFTGIIPLAPEKLHSDVKRKIKELYTSPFKSSAMNFRLRALRNRYSSLNSYWQRVLKQKEEGTYSKDLFKANLREKIALEESRAQTGAGKAEQGLQSLFNSYKQAVEKQTGKAQSLDFKAFQENLMKRAKDFKEKHGAKKLSFKVIVKDGKVSVQATAKG